MTLYGLNSPCRECEDRTPGCNCEAYKLYRKELDARKAKATADRNRESFITAYQIDRKASANRKKNGKNKRKWRGI